MVGGSVVGGVFSQNPSNVIIDNRQKFSIVNVPDSSDQKLFQDMSNYAILNKTAMCTRRLTEDVEIRASKGRKIRYLKIPKAVDFMYPEKIDFFSELQRNNILEQMKSTCDLLHS